MKTFLKFTLSILFICLVSMQLNAQEKFTPEDLLELKSVRGTQISPDGSELIYSISTPRTSNEKAGGSHSTYYRMNLKSGESILLFEEGSKAGSPQWSPAGNYIGFKNKDDNGISQVFALHIKSGNIKQLTYSDISIGSYKLNPSGIGLAYTIRQPKSEKEKELNKRGYGFIFYEENLKSNHLFVSSFNPETKQNDVKQLSTEMNVWNFEFNKQGTQIAATLSEKPLIDQSYMFRKIYVFDLLSGEQKLVLDNKGKLGNYTFSPDGTKLAYTGALNLNDHAVSQLFILDLASNKVTNITPAHFHAHINWATWKSDKELLFKSGEGVYPKLSLISVNGGERKVLLDAADNGLIFGTPTISDDFKKFVFTANTPTDPGNIYFWNGKKKLNKISDVNPQLASKSLAKQEVFQYSARDGELIDGVILYPNGYDVNTTYPLIVYVHGGPESHHSNGWLSRYSTPGQVMANNGYLVVYLNYRASTGYGVEFAMEGFMDPAGKEFDDIADAMEFLIKEKGADRERIGMAGGSYGGYASGWFATYYTQYVRAVCDFVGISNIISKRGTTDIAYEELYVHSGELLEKQWKMNLERSPIYWAHQSKTATLIYGGASDTRVHPSQSMELYRRMKMNDHPAVRLVQYPGEGHGNRKQVGQIDVLYRQIEWLDWYVKDLNPLNGPMPRLDVSERYGLDWEF